MRIHVQQVNVPLAYDNPMILQRVGRKIGCDPASLSNPRIIRRSLDARARNPEPVYALNVEVDLDLPALPHAAKSQFVEILPEPEEAEAPSPMPRLEKQGTRPVVVGAGPAGLMAAYQLAIAGARPLLIDRGDDAAGRAPKVAEFWNQGLLDPESNVLFGEGGAGLFSDGKLTARSKERGRIRDFMKLLHTCGANENVLIDAEPHVGSDALLTIVPRLREQIIAAGGEVRFRSRLESVIIEAGQLRAIVVNGEEIACMHCVLAVGHSARDVYEMLAERGVALEPKPFAIGVRLEIPQSAIDHAQYGRFAGSPRLGAASFRLTRREENGIRSCYSFCMCPGGKVISCASEPGLLTTNGMSYSKRSLPLGNAAFLVPVGPADYPAHPVPALAGMEFQRKLERDAFTAAGGGYRVPACRLVDFLAKQAPTTLPEGGSCPTAVPVHFRGILPDFVTLTLESSIPPMLRELHGVRLEDAVLYAPETRSSSPLWISRTPEGESTSTRGLYPAGEGAGYAGGIVSSAIDGMRAAEHVLKSFYE
jgi:uncharacterized FAD-dependent dehydrogenase